MIMMCLNKTLYSRTGSDWIWCLDHIPNVEYLDESLVPTKYNVEAIITIVIIITITTDALLPSMSIGNSGWWH